MTTLRTEKQRDRNYLSLNELTIVLFAGTDHEEHHGYDEFTIPSDVIPVDPKDWETALKGSGCRDIHLTNLRVAQCKENALDLNNGAAHCSFGGDWGVVGTSGEQVITTKGGSHDIVVSGVVHSRGTDCDIELGSWSDQSLEQTHTIDLSSLRHITGRPLIVVMGRVRSPLLAALGRSKDIILPPKAKVLFWASIAEQFYWWLKRCAIAVGLIHSKYNRQT